MSATTRIFLSEQKPILKRTFSVNEDDYLAIARIFPEAGFLQYFPGFCFKALVEALNKKGINNAADRDEFANSTLTSLVSNLRTAFETGCGHDRRGTDGIHEAPAFPCRVSAGPEEVDCRSNQVNHGNEEKTDGEIGTFVKELIG